MSEFLYPQHYLDRSSKCQLLGQRNKLVWLTGLSGAGKSTIAKLLEQQLHRQGFKTVVLDGDNLRTGLCQGLGFSLEDRAENVRRCTETAKICLNAGLIVIVALISPMRAMREQAKEIIGEADFLEVFVEASAQICAQRDVKGLYQKAQSNQIGNFTSVSQPYENPSKPFITLPTAEQNPAQSCQMLLEALLPLIQL